MAQVGPDSLLANADLLHQTAKDAVAAAAAAAKAAQKQISQGKAWKSFTVHQTLDSREADVLDFLEAAQGLLLMADSDEEAAAPSKSRLSDGRQSRVPLAQASLDSDSSLQVGSLT